MKYKVWECKIVVPVGTVIPGGGDAPPRRAAILAVEERLGVDVIHCFSGWGGSLTEGENQIVDNDCNRPQPGPSSTTAGQGEEEALTGDQPAAS